MNLVDELLCSNPILWQPFCLLLVLVLLLCANNQLNFWAICKVCVSFVLGLSMVMVIGYVLNHVKFCKYRELLISNSTSSIVWFSQNVHDDSTLLFFGYASDVTFVLTLICLKLQSSQLLRNYKNVRMVCQALLVVVNLVHVSVTSYETLKESISGCIIGVTTAAITNKLTLVRRVESVVRIDIC